MKLSRLQASMQLTKLEMSPLTTSSLLPVLMPSTKISSISSPLGSPLRHNETQPAHLWEFWKVCHRLSVFDSVALLDQRLVIPCSLRSVNLSNLHSANRGVTGVRFHANQCVYWSGLDLGIQNHWAMCHDHIRNVPSQPPEPLILTLSPTYLFDQLCADYFHIRHFSYITTVDRFSGWICIYSFKANESIPQPYRTSSGTCLWPIESLRNSAQMGAHSSCQRSFRIFSNYGESSTGCHL